MGQVSGIRLEVACANALMPAQYQQTDRLLAQLWGRCRVLLLGPDQVRASLLRHCGCSKSAGVWHVSPHGHPVFRKDACRRRGE